MVKCFGEKGEGTILVVDDEECLRHVAGIALTASGYKVLKAGTAHDALQVAENHSGKIDLLLTDLRLPDVDGIQLAAKFRKLYPGVQVVFITACSRDDAAEWLPNENVLLKPFGLETLCSMVGQSLELVA